MTRVAPSDAVGSDHVIEQQITVEGIVQGVGFRPFVYRLATELGIAGHVGNDSSSVFIEAIGPPAALDVFASRLVADAPPMARVDQLLRTTNDAAAVERSGFEIVGSRDAIGPRTLVAPDTAMCGDCVRELFDPADRRHRHPFITCTNCGPRFTIIAAVPYDRPNTTMAGFAMCGACEVEYRNPSDRRYHAQPIACHDCGPRLTFTLRDAAERPVDDDPIQAVVDALDTGAIVAVKGLGGYHLAADATSDAVIAELRKRKRRADKPFAVMVADLDRARDLAHISDTEAEFLTSPAAPIVLVPARSGTPLAPAVAPGNPLVGVMLPYTPIHHLLLAARDAPLVMTSANLGGEPIVWRRDDLDRIDGLYDAVLDHDRPIRLPCDDSVIRLVGDQLLPIRRARGYAPIPVALPHGGRPVLAVGGELKNTFCVASDGQAWVGQHIGDMANLATLDAFTAGVAQFTEMYDVIPDIVATDAHPGYLSSRWARDHHVDRVVEIQHHHAHIAAVMAERGLPPTDPVLGFAFDGTGYGHDGTIWGGELLIASAEGFERVANLAPIQLPGGDAAIRSPARIALAHLDAVGLPWRPDLPPVAYHTEGELRLLRQQLDSGVACMATTSMGRLFDAVASLVGLRHEITYEAQAAIDLEIAAQRSIDEHDDGQRTGHGRDVDCYRFEIDGSSIVSSSVLEAIVADLVRGTSPGVIAARFHHALAEIVERWSIHQRARTGITTVVLSGGVFQNALLIKLCVERLSNCGFDVYTNTVVPPNDGGLSLGQAFIASYRPVNPNPVYSKSVHSKS